MEFNRVAVEVGITLTGDALSQGAATGGSRKARTWTLSDSLHSRHWTTCRMHIL